MELLKFMTTFIPNVFLIFSFKRLNSQAAVMLAPTGTIHEICVGKSLEFMCNITGMLLEWNFPIVSEAQVLRLYMRAITAEGAAEAQTFQLLDNATTYSFTRTSAEGSPVSSTLLISTVGNSHNGTEITCLDVSSQPEETASTTIVVIDSQIQDLSEMRIRADSEFKIDGVKVTLEWLSQENPLYSYYVEVDPQIATYGNSSAIMLMLSYNTPYNVSVLAGNLCEENLTIFNQYFNYSKCDVPSANMISDNTLMILTSYNESVAVVGSNITFTCIPGIEPNNATCMENGEWKPHLSCTRMITESDVSLQNSAKTSSDTLIVLASTFGIIVFIVLIIIAALVLFVAYSIRRAKCTRSKVSSERKSHYECVSASAGTCPTDNHQNNTESKDTVYADIGPSSFNQHLVRQQLHTPAIDNDAVEYAQIKHNSQHVQAPSLKSKTKPTEFKSNINDSPNLNVNLDNLLIQLRPQVTPMWYQFGEAAEIDKEVLDNFAKQCSPEDCIMEVLDYWLRKSIKQPTWADVAKILKTIHLSQLALQIENVYLTGRLPVQVDMNWIPQSHVEISGADPSDICMVDTDSMSTPPRIPSKANESALHPVSNAVPALPPKPKAY